MKGGKIVFWSLTFTKRKKWNLFVNDKIGRKKYVRMSAKINKIKRVSQREI